MLDTELKREYQQFLQEHNRGKSDSDGRPDRSPDEIARWAMDHDLRRRTVTFTPMRASSTRTETAANRRATSK